MIAADYPPPPAPARAAAPPRVRLQVAFLTGPVPGQAPALSPEQRALLAALPHDPALRVVACDFPYGADAEAAVWRRAPLWRASLRNVATYLRARSPGFAAAHAPAMLALLARAEHTLLLAGSCGLELLAGLRLPAPWLRRITVIAYGPVARRAAAAVAALHVASGTRDPMAWFYRLPADCAPRCGHLGYLADPVFRRWCAGLIRHHPALAPTHAAAL
jgi:hypothetical protein